MLVLQTTSTDVNAHLSSSTNICCLPANLAQRRSVLDSVIFSRRARGPSSSDLSMTRNEQGDAVCSVRPSANALATDQVASRSLYGKLWRRHGTFAVRVSFLSRPNCAHSWRASTAALDVTRIHEVGATWVARPARAPLSFEVSLVPIRAGEGHETYAILSRMHTIDRERLAKLEPATLEPDFDVTRIDQHHATWGDRRGDCSTRSDRVSSRSVHGKGPNEAEIYWKMHKISHCLHRHFEQ